jgi:hypothetical protein
VKLSVADVDGEHARAPCASSACVNPPVDAPTSIARAPEIAGAQLEAIDRGFELSSGTADSHGSEDIRLYPCSSPCRHASATFQVAATSVRLRRHEHERASREAALPRRLVRHRRKAFGEVRPGTRSTAGCRWRADRADLLARAARRADRRRMLASFLAQARPSRARRA